MSVTPTTRPQTEQGATDGTSQIGQLESRAVSVVTPLTSSPSSSSIPRRSIEASNAAFLSNLFEKQSVVQSHQIACLPTAHLNRFSSAQQEMLNNSIALCRQLPNGNDDETLAAVNQHFNLFIDMYNLLIRQQRLGERFRLRAEDHFALLYRLAQSYTCQRASDKAIDFLDFSIADMAKNLTDAYLPFWDRAISLRTSIISSSNPPQRSHQLNISSIEMKLKFIIDSADAFRRIEETGLAASYYELALKEQEQDLSRRPYGPRPKGINPLKRSNIRQFLLEFYLSSAPLIMSTSPETAIQLYEKALKLESKPEVFKIVFDYYIKRKNNAVSIDQIKTRIDSLKKVINLLSSHGDPESPKLPEMRNELFESYFEYGRECIKTNQFEKGVNLFNQALNYVEKENCLVDRNRLTTLKKELFKTLVDWSILLEAQKNEDSALDRVREALDFQRVHQLNIDIAKIEELMKRNEELSKKVGIQD